MPNNLTVGTILETSVHFRRHPLAIVLDFIPEPKTAHKLVETFEKRMERFFEFRDHVTLGSPFDIDPATEAEDRPTSTTKTSSISFGEAMTAVANGEKVQRLNWKLRSHLEKQNGHHVGWCSGTVQNSGEYTPTTYDILANDWEVVP